MVKRREQIAGTISEETYFQLYGERDGTTRFMRSVDAYPEILDILKGNFFEKKKDGLEIAIAGCSTGEEVYSYALLCETDGYTNYRVDGNDVQTNYIRKPKIG